MASLKMALRRRIGAAAAKGRFARAAARKRMDRAAAKRRFTLASARRRLSSLWSGLRLGPTLALLLLPALLLALGRYLGLQRFDAMWSTPGWWAEYLLLLCPALLFWALFDRAWAVWLAEGIPLLLLTTVNYYKLRLNGVPLEPADFTLLTGAGEIMSFALPQLRLNGPMIGSLLFWAAVLAGLILLRKRLCLGGKKRLIPLCAGVVLAASLFTGFAAVRETAGAGPVLRLYAAWIAGREEKRSAGADEETLADIRAQLTATPTPEPTPAPTPEAVSALEPEPTPQPTPEPEPVIPTVIFLMSESFFDVTELPGLEFDADPLETYHALAAEHASGKFLSNTYCGGTGYVEMEVLTGLCSGLLHAGDTLTSLPDERYPYLPCISDVFAAQGYEMTFLHSYNSRLYNRAVIYDAFGFGRVLFDDAFPEDAEKRGGYISDIALSEMLLSLLAEEHDAPQMIFTVSMENHQPYSAAKFGESCSSGLRCDKLEEDELAVLDAYVSGLEDADRGLKKLTDALRDSPEPVMLVFWGDHRPNLGLADGRNVYEELGQCSGTDTEAWAPAELAEMLSTNWLIWTNYGLEAEDRTESSTMLGLHVLETLGFELTDYYRWLRMVADGRYLMYRPRLYADPSGLLAREIPEPYEKMMKSYAAVVYDVVYGDHSLFDTGRRGQS